jgi:hypothetical protein
VPPDDGIWFQGDPSSTALEIGGVPIPGAYRVLEEGAGYTTEYVAERKQQAGEGSTDSTESVTFTREDVRSTDLKPPATRWTINAWARDATHESLIELRDREESFTFDLNDFSGDEIGMKSLESNWSANVAAGIKELTIVLQQFRVRVIAETKAPVAPGSSPSDPGGQPSYPKTVSGQIQPQETAEFAFSGEITALSATPAESAEITVDGETVDQSQFSNGTSSSPTPSGQ